MNILHVSKFYYPKVGGIEQVIKQLAEGAVARGETARVLSATDRGRGSRTELNSVSVAKASSLGVALSVPLAPTFPVHLRHASVSADLVHFHLPDPLSVTSWTLARRSDIPVVATYHNDIVRQEQVLRFYRPVLDRFLDDVDRILVTSPRLRDESPFLAPYTDKCRVVPLSIDLDEYGDYEGPPFDLPVTGDRPVLLFVGRLIYYKGLKYAIDAMTDVDADLLIVGTGPLRESLEVRARERGVADRVTFLGYVKEDRLHYCYDRADVFVFPSVAASEGFGIVQLEAMAYRTPVVNTDLPTGVPWVSRDGETGVTVPPRDAAAIAGAINELLADPDLRAQYGAAARTRVAEQFADDRLVDGTHEVYDELLNRE
jgi:rhamnosyl/mannosyltransferase